MRRKPCDALPAPAANRVTDLESRSRAARFARDKSAGAWSLAFL
jgi:hypothetical protein